MRRRDPNYLESGDGELERLLSLCLDRGIPTPRSIRLCEHVDGEAIHREVLFEFDSDSSPRPPQIVTDPKPGVGTVVTMEAAKEMAKLGVGDFVKTLRFFVYYVVHRVW